MAATNVRQFETWLKGLEHDLSPIITYLEDCTVTDIMFNSDGKLFVSYMGKGTVFVGDDIIDSSCVRRIINWVASLHDRSITIKHPVLEGVIPKYNARIHAFVEPWVTAPSFCIRKLPSKIFSLNDYLATNRLSQKYYDVIVRLIHERKNVIIGGGTNTGKTTLLNAIINKIAEELPNDRIYLVEDTLEIRCTALNYESLWIPSEFADEGVRGALRYKPDRIVFGELRHGRVARELLKAFNTGHPGGWCTTHADSAERILDRVFDLLHETEGTPLKTTVSSSINACIFMKNIPGLGPKVDDIIQVFPDLSSDGQFKFEHF